MIDLSTLDTLGLAEAVHSRAISAVELLRHVQERVAQYDPAINAVVEADFEAALVRAKAADMALGKGQSLGPLHGIPITLKDCWEVAGFAATAGATDLANYRPKTNALLVDKLVRSGANIYGKTNTPAYAMDVQTYNDVHGVTNNPWRQDRTSGGSSGGSAAAVAAGFTTLEVGSDIGGSIRTPAHYCGVYGHKPTHNILSMQGHVPGPPGTRAIPDLAVAGPIARSARDLAFALDLLAGPDPLHAVGWQLNLPKPRHQTLADFRVALWLDDATCPIDSEMRTLFESVADTLQKCGASVVEAKPASLPKILSIYYTLLASVTGASLTRAQYGYYMTVKEDLPPI